MLTSEYFVISMCGVSKVQRFFFLFMQPTTAYRLSDYSLLRRGGNHKQNSKLWFLLQKALIFVNAEPSLHSCTLGRRRVSYSRDRTNKRMPIYCTPNVRVWMPAFMRISRLLLYLLIGPLVRLCITVFARWPHLLHANVLVLQIFFIFMALIFDGYFETLPRYVYCFSKKPYIPANQTTASTTTITSPQMLPLFLHTTTPHFKCNCFVCDPCFSVARKQSAFGMRQYLLCQWLFLPGHRQ